MKKITKIEIENSRAYYDRLTFSMEKGENVLLYGEMVVERRHYISR